MAAVDVRNELCAFLEGAGDYEPVDTWLFESALTHASCGGISLLCAQNHNERLTYLGSQVWSLVAAEYALQADESAGEGPLTQYKNQYENAAYAARCAKYLRVVRAIRHISLTSDPTESMCAGAFKALVGAVYTDSGSSLEPIRALFEYVRAELPVGSPEDHRSPKSLLLERLQEKFGSDGQPSYTTIKTTGQPHCRVFTVQVFCKGISIGEGVGGKKKEAEAEAAQDALDRMRHHPEWE